MRVEYDSIVRVERLKRPVNRPHLVRTNGYAVLLEDEWFWFSAVEPAYVFGRAGRMSRQVGSWRVVKAAIEARFDDDLNRDVITLYLDERSAVKRDATNDQELIRRFADGLDSHSSHWRISKG